MTLALSLVRESKIAQILTHLQPKFGHRTQKEYAVSGPWISQKKSPAAHAGGAFLMADN